MNEKLIQILIEKINDLEQENEILHSQVDLIDVYISDSEAESILNSMKKNRSIEHIDQNELDVLLMSVESLTDCVERLESDPSSKFEYIEARDDVLSQIEIFESHIEGWKKQILAMDKDVMTLTKEGKDHG